MRTLTLYKGTSGSIVICTTIKKMYVNSCTLYCTLACAAATVGAPLLLMLDVGCFLSSSASIASFSAALSLAPPSPVTMYLSASASGGGTDSVLFGVGEHRWRISRSAWHHRTRAPAHATCDGQGYGDDWLPIIRRRARARMVTDTCEQLGALRGDILVILIHLHRTNKQQRVSPRQPLRARRRTGWYPRSRPG
jgi:hypothetical protein